MWIPAKLFDLLHIGRDTFAATREELAGLRAERDALKSAIASMSATADWLRIRVNALEMENKALLQKAYNISLPVPEVVRAPNAPIDPQREKSLFDDLGEDLARAMGYPSHAIPPTLS